MSTRESEDPREGDEAREHGYNNDDDDAFVGVVARFTYFALVWRGAPFSPLHEACVVDLTCTQAWCVLVAGFETYATCHVRFGGVVNLFRVYK